MNLVPLAPQLSSHGPGEKYNLDNQGGNRRLCVVLLTGVCTGNNNSIIFLNIEHRKTELYSFSALDDLMRLQEFSPLIIPVKCLICHIFNSY